MITITKATNCCFVRTYKFAFLSGRNILTSRNIFINISNIYIYKNMSHTFLLTFTKYISITFIYTGQLKIPLCSTSCYQNLSKTSLKPIWKHCSYTKSYLEHLNYLYILKVILFYTATKSHSICYWVNTVLPKASTYCYKSVHKSPHENNCIEHSICIYISIYKVVSIDICISVYKSRLHLLSCLLLRHHHFIYY